MPSNHPKWTKNEKKTKFITLMLRIQSKKQSFPLLKRMKQTIKPVKIYYIYYIV